MKTYRRKPYTVKAIQYFYNDAVDPDKNVPFLDWIQAGFAFINNEKQLVLPNIQGAEIARHGDWIIEDADGNLRTCSHRYFLLNFEEVT